jgi:hypothetical protein
MTERDQLVMTRDLLLRAARKELVEFERREIEFRKKDREERAAELRLPFEGDQASLRLSLIGRRSPRGLVQRPRSRRVDQQRP